MISLSTISPDRKTASDNLPEAGEHLLYPVKLLSLLHRPPEIL